MLRDKFNDIFHKIQQSASCHQKYRQVLVKLYKESPFEDFEIEFMRCVEVIFAHDVTHKNVYVERGMEFVGSFIAAVVNEIGTPNDTEDDSASNTSTTPFFETILYDILKYHNLESQSARFRTCQLIHLLLSNLGDNISIDSEVWDSLIEPLLERLKDSKPNVRVQAARGLARLQTPNDPNCQVVAAFLERLYDVNTQVRKEIVHLIAPTKLTVHKIVERVRDIDQNVRLAAFRKCSVMGPKVLSINVRQSTLNNGFNERTVTVKNFFLQEMLPSWLGAYGGDYLKFLDALKLDSSEEDLKQSEVICKSVLKVFFKSNQLAAIVELLPIDENKVIPIDQLNYQSALYWCTLVGHLRELDDADEYLCYVIPELLPFCVYIESVVRENQKLEGWKYLEYQHNLSQLLKVAGQFDLTDEVGRRALHKLITDLLMKTKFNEQVIYEMISILALLNPNLDSLTSEICHIISDVREPLVEQQPSEDKLRDRNFKLADLRVKINIATEDCTEAASKGDFDEAKSLREQLTQYKKEFEELNAEFNTDKNLIRQTQNDPDTVIRCLDILIGMLSYSKLQTLTISLRTCKDEFVLPLWEDNNPEVHLKVYKCLMLFCTLDKALTQQNLKLICSPLLFYRFTPHENTRVLLISIGAISDLMRLFGCDILKPSEEANKSNTNLTRNQNTTTRRLYTIENIDNAECIDFNLITCEDIINTLLEMLDDEREEIRNQTGKALCELVIAQITVSPTLMSKLILKWLISSTEKEDIKLQQLLGNTLLYVARMNGSGEIFERTVIPVLTSIGNAPRTSPVADIDVDNAMRFLAAITSVDNQTGFVNVHKNLAYSLCYKILNRPEEKCVPLYIKMLLNLDLVLDNDVVTRELINQTELILEEIVEKTSKRNVQKFLGKLKLQITGDAENGAAVEDKDKENSAVNVNANFLTESTQNEPVHAEANAKIAVEAVAEQREAPEVPHNESSPVRVSTRVKKKTKKVIENEKEVNASDKQAQPVADAEKPITKVKVTRQLYVQLQVEKKKSKTKEAKQKKSSKKETETEVISEKRRKEPETVEQPLNITRRTSDRVRNKSLTSQNQDDSPIVSSQSKTPTAKRRKQRGKNKEDSVASTGSSFSDETILHTIVHEDDEAISLLEDDDVSIQSATSPDSKSSSSRYSTRSSKGSSNNVTITETSSDSDASLRRSSRTSSRTKKRKVYIP